MWLGAVFCILLILSSVSSSHAGRNSVAYISDQTDLRVEVVASNLVVPWSLAFAPDGRLFFTERLGRVRVIVEGQLQEEPAAQLNVAAVGEAGLLGLAIDPEFERNRHVYVYYSYQLALGGLWNRVARLSEANNRLFNETIILDGIPGAGIHDGGRIKFGPDGKLYITTGDAANAELSQDINSLAGKILRINKDGSIPLDNPFPNSSVYTLGHRNPQGIDWHPLTGKLFLSEHGSSAHDEVNIIEPGKNYGWPIVIGGAGDPRFTDPLLESGTTTWAPSGASFYDGDLIPDWKGNFFIATLRGKHLRMVSLNPPNFDSVMMTEALFQDQYGRLRDVIQGPDGYLYISTSNRDGRGSPATDDDRILRIASVSATTITQPTTTTIQPTTTVPTFAAPFRPELLLLTIAAIAIVLLVISFRRRPSG